jgi:hypothetical protein
LLDCQMREKRVHFWHTNRGRMALIVEENKALDPVRIPTFRPSALEFEADGLANEIEEFRYVIYRGAAL